MQLTIRSQEGFSISTMLALGVVASLWIMGTVNLIVPATARLTSDRTTELARCSAEAAIDYTMQQLNDPNTRSATLSASTISIPASVMADYVSTNSPTTHLTGTVTLQNIRPPLRGQSGSAYTSYLYDATVDDQSTTSALYGNGSDNNMWRVATATVTNGIMSRAVRVVLKPVLDSTTVTTSRQVTGTPIPIFQYSAFGITGIGGSGSLSTNSYDSGVKPNPSSFDTLASAYPNHTLTQDLAMPGYGDLASDGNANFTSNPIVGGNLVLFGSNNTAAAGSSTTIDGAVQAANPMAPLMGGSRDVVMTTQAAPLPPTPPTPLSPTPLPGGASAIDLSRGATMTLTQGNYVVNYINIVGSTSKLTIDPSAGPVNIWVQGSSTTGINVAGQVVNSSGVASNLRIWFNGTQSVQVSSNNNFVGTIYAPNASVTISGNGSIFGSVVGNQVILNGNGALHFDRALMRNGGLSWTPIVSTSTTSVTQYLNNFQAVSWHEFNPASSM